MTDTDIRKKFNFPLFNKDNFRLVLAIIDKLTEIGQKHDATPAQVALAWLLAQGPNVIPIPGTKKIKYLEENWNSLEVKLTDEKEKEVRRFVESSRIAGLRMPDWAVEGHSYITTRPEQ